MRFNLGYDHSQEIFERLKLAKPADATGSYAFKWDYLLDSFLSKHPSLGAGVDAKTRAAKAINKTLASNERCRQINELGYNDDSYSFRCIIARASSICATVLGEFDLSLFEAAAFTNGASTSRTKEKGDPFYKYNRMVKVDVTDLAFPYAYALISATPRWAAEGGLHNINIVRGNAITTVPKDAEIDRTIGMEPDLNGLLQNAIGKALLTRLRRVGINLRDQTSNQALAWIGSCDNSLATIDLSSASDSISHRIVWDLIPPDWYRVMLRIRSPFGELPDGSTISWSMFSSMGNGFTFGLETLIFFSLAKAVMEESGLKVDVGGNCQVYGDDIIVPSACADRLLHVLASVGFLPNKKKTFVDGPFRESCGKHYWDGNDVTPFYVRSPITDLSRLLWFLNRLRDWAYDEVLDICDPSIAAIWLYYRRKYIPYELAGDTNTDSTTTLATLDVPESPSQVVFDTLQRPLKGWRALLRWFQYQSICTENVQYAELDRTKLVADVCQYTGSQSSNCLTRVLPHMVSLRQRDHVCNGALTADYCCRRRSALTKLFTWEVLCDTSG